MLLKIIGQFWAEIFLEFLCRPFCNFSTWPQAQSHCDLIELEFKPQCLIRNHMVFIHHASLLCTDWREMSAILDANSVNICVQDTRGCSSLLHTGIFQHISERDIQMLPPFNILMLSPLLIENRGAGHDGRPPGRTRTYSSKARRRGASGTQLTHRWGSLSTPLSHIEGRPAESHRKLETGAGEPDVETTGTSCLHWLGCGGQCGLFPS